MIPRWNCRPVRFRNLNRMPSLTAKADLVPMAEKQAAAAAAIKIFHIMKKLSLSVLGMYCSILAAWSQTTDSSLYKMRKLHLDEVNFVSGYYHQDGNNSAVTGGIGTE